MIRRTSTVLPIKDIGRATRLYSQNVLEHYENPRNVGSFPNEEENVGTGIVGAPACGDVMKFQIKVKDSKVVDAKFKTFGCGSAIASSSYSSEYVKGKELEELMDISNRDIASYLKLPPVKLHCSMLAEDAIKSAVKNYQNRHEKKEN